MCWPVSRGHKFDSLLVDLGGLKTTLFHFGKPRAITSHCHPRDLWVRAFMGHPISPAGPLLWHASENQSCPSTDTSCVNEIYRDVSLPWTPAAKTAECGKMNMSALIRHLVYEEWLHVNLCLWRSTASLMYYLLTEVKWLSRNKLSLTSHQKKKKKAAMRA